MERSNKTHQDRLVKELRLRNISTMEEANKFIKDVYIPRHNTAFAVKAAKEGDVHRPIVNHTLDDIFCIKEERIIQNDFTVQYKKRIIQLLAEQKAAVRPKETVTIFERFNGALSIAIRNFKLNFTEIERRPVKVHEIILRQHKAWKPALNHPLRLYSPVTPSKSYGGY